MLRKLSIALIFLFLGCMPFDYLYVNGRDKKYKILTNDFQVIAESTYSLIDFLALTTSIHVKNLSSNKIFYSKNELAAKIKYLKIDETRIGFYLENKEISPEKNNELIPILPKQELYIDIFSLKEDVESISKEWAQNDTLFLNLGNLIIDNSNIKLQTIFFTGKSPS
jgi:hypothetical protein